MIVGSEKVKRKHLLPAGNIYEGVSKSFRPQSITKYTTINTCWETTQRVMEAKLT